MWILDFGGQGGAVQPHSRKKPGGRTLMFKREMNASPGLRICEGDQEEGKDGKTAGSCAAFPFLHLWFVFHEGACSPGDFQPGLAEAKLSGECWMSSSFAGTLLPPSPWEQEMQKGKAVCVLLPPPKNLPNLCGCLSPLRGCRGVSTGGAFPHLEKSGESSESLEPCWM